ncbi:MAG: SH3 domain-containing protein [Paracoccus sp. (in: a-proteobacteria)]|uniref:SH3 domain-containing protein n=1 Tax=Paracoccus sp. TaxID=267 RepID=UPI0026DF6B59|nr:SH3 domain-containing protein [Paracoccus sp. (in: a-proteobacteria)]MDO5620684.1 SH3 domain-containing protein [Paracoccus sp. (in: a-proteobacteria)]
MFKARLFLLPLLIVAALGVIWLVMSRTPDAPAQTTPAAVAQVESPAPAVAAPTEAAPVETTAPAPDAAQVTQTPERRARFPGPALRPSPQYADSPAPGDGAAEVEQRGGTVAYITGNRVNYREGPSTSNSVIGALTRGTAVERLETMPNGWVQIIDPQGRRGYISGQFLSDQP